MEVAAMAPTESGADGAARAPVEPMEVAAGAPEEDHGSTPTLHARHGAATTAAVAEPIQGADGAAGAPVEPMEVARGATNSALDDHGLLSTPLHGVAHATVAHAADIDQALDDHGLLPTPLHGDAHATVADGDAAGALVQPMEVAAEATESGRPRMREHYASLTHGSDNEPLPAAFSQLPKISVAHALYLGTPNGHQRQAPAPNPLDKYGLAAL
mmetsp:Transcript_14482/g.31370  ORF Transcript_14482/g.31370 Transcript_14482/m.31370 type:complete len:214 (-) Transcript_14482:252-893(-)